MRRIGAIRIEPFSSLRTSLLAFIVDDEDSRNASSMSGDPRQLP
ncbi:MAG TPA: hypothetical protein VNO19_02800 [Gemmatimonadales bacterium]|nr:hypothetical protein [Gemmatimonadales bacterium]